MFGPAEIVIVLLIVLIVFGAGKLPSVMKDVGKGMKSFKDAVNDEGKDTLHIEANKAGESQENIAAIAPVKKKSAAKKKVGTSSKKVGKKKVATVKKKASATKKSTAKKKAATTKKKASSAKKKKTTAKK